MIVYYFLISTALVVTLFLLNKKYRYITRRENDSYAYYAKDGKNIEKVSFWVFVFFFFLLWIIIIPMLLVLLGGDWLLNKISDDNNIPLK
jgi:ABC-type Fe3+ transport system permease subunit